jgi:hypothetical protein
MEPTSVSCGVCEGDNYFCHATDNLYDSFGYCELDSAVYPDDPSKRCTPPQGQCENPTQNYNYPSENACNSCPGDYFCYTETYQGVGGECVHAEGKCDVYNPGQDCDPDVCTNLIWGGEPLPGMYCSNERCENCCGYKEGQECVPTGGFQPGTYWCKEICDDYYIDNTCDGCCAEGEVCKTHTYTGRYYCGPADATCGPENVLRCGKTAGCPTGYECQSIVIDDLAGFSCIQNTDKCGSPYIVLPDAFEGVRAPSPFSIQAILNLFRDDVTAGEASNFLTVIYKIAAPLIVVIGMILVILSGYGLMTSTGDPRKLMDSKSKLTAALTGLAIALFAAAALRLIITATII